MRIENPLIFFHSKLKKMKKMQLMDQNGKVSSFNLTNVEEKKEYENLPIISFVNFYHGNNYHFFKSILNGKTFPLKENFEDIQGIRLVKMSTPDHEIGILEIENGFDKNLIKKFSSLAFRASNAIIISTWFQNLWTKGGIEQFFFENLFSQIKSKDCRNVDFKTSIVICVHDFDKDYSSEKEIKAKLEDEFSKLWEKVCKEEKIEEQNPFELNIFLLTHYKYQSEMYQKECGIISKMISREGVLISNKKYNKKITLTQIFEILSLGGEKKRGVGRKSRK